MQSPQPKPSRPLTPSGEAPPGTPLTGDRAEFISTPAPDPPPVADQPGRRSGRAALWIIWGGGAALIGIVAGLVVVTGVDDIAHGDRPTLHYRVEGLKGGTP